MQKLPLLLLVVFLSYIGSFISVEAAPQTLSAGSVVIEVVDNQTQQPLDDVIAELFTRDTNTSVTSSALSDRQAFAKIAAGLYALHLYHPNYQTLIQPSVRIVNGKTTVLKLTMLKKTKAMENVVVYNDGARLDSLTSASARYFDRESLRSNAGSGSDVLRALDGLPGLFSGGEFASYTVRGNGPRDNLIFVDGLPFANIVHFDDGFGEQEEVEGGGRYSVFAPNLINGAMFQPGGWSAAYGGKAGSLLQLDVARGNSESASFTARVDLAGVEVGYDGPSHVFGNTSVLFSARQQDFGRFFETIGVEDVGSPENTDIILKTSTRIDDLNDIDVLLIYAPEEYQRDIDNVLASDDDEPGNYEDVELAQHDTDNQLFGLTWSHMTKNNGIWTNRWYYRYFQEQGTIGEAYPDLVAQDSPAALIPRREEIIFSSGEETEFGYRSDFTQWNDFGEYNIGLRYSQTDLAFKLTLKDDWIRYVYDQDDFRQDPEQKYLELTPDTFNSELERVSKRFSVYADQTFEFDRWQLRTGIRLDRDNLADDTVVSPRLNVNWRANNKMKLVFTAGRYNQAPRFSDIASASQNATLQHELTDQISLGVSYLLRPDIELLVEPYYQRLSDLIVQLDDTSLIGSNSGEGRSWGVDSAVIKRFGNGWSANLNYSYNHAEIKDSPNGHYYDSDFNRPHSFGIGSSWEINQRWKVSARWKWASGTPNDAYSIHTNVLGDEQPLRYSKELIATNTERFKHYQSLNFRVDYQRSFGNVSVIAFLDVINAYGSDNPSYAEFNERAGYDVVEKGEVLPILGLRFAW